MALLLALASAVAYGTADFAGGIAARSRSALVVTATSAAIGLVVFAVAITWVAGDPTPSAIGWGAASGVVGMLAAAALYSALAIGPMTVVAPLTATISGATPVVYSILTGQTLTPLAWLGLVLVLGAAGLISAVSESAPAAPPRPRRARLRAVLLAAIAGLLFGAFYIFLAQTPSDSGFVPLLANRAAGLCVLVAALGWLAIARRMRGQAQRSILTAVGLAPAIVTGLFDATANALFVLAVRDGALAVVSVIASLYPAVTIGLSATVLRERISGVQWIGIAAALAGVALLAL